MPRLRFALTAVASISAGLALTQGCGSNAGGPGFDQEGGVGSFGDDASGGGVRGRLGDELGQLGSNDGGWRSEFAAVGGKFVHTGCKFVPAGGVRLPRAIVHASSGCEFVPSGDKFGRRG